MINVSGLPLLAYKIGPNLFDLSSNLHHVSMRDQIHRAIALAEALVESKQCKGDEQVLIIGAGVAGAVAGMVLARHNINAQIIDSADGPFSLQRNVKTRLVGPYMYEWPLAVYDCQQMPPIEDSVLHPWVDKRPPTPLGFSDSLPQSPDQLVQIWDCELAKAIKNSNGQLRLQVKINTVDTNKNVLKWLRNQQKKPRKLGQIAINGGKPWGASKAAVGRMKTRFVVLAAGMGKERNVIESQDGSEIRLESLFWKDDNIRAKRCGLTDWKPRVVVIGGGDGGLQDTLRAATRDDHPLETWGHLVKAGQNKELPKALANIQALEAQHVLTTIWAQTSDLLEELRILDRAYQNLAVSLAQDTQIRQAALDRLRDDVKSVHLCIREECFSKAYALNRFLVHLLEQCLKVEQVHCPLLQVIRQADVKIVRCSTGDNLANATPTTTLRVTVKNESPRNLEADIVMLRFGSDGTQLSGKWLGLKTKDTINRFDLAAVPLPLYLPPT